MKGGTAGVATTLGAVFLAGVAVLPPTTSFSTSLLFLSRAAPSHNNSPFSADTTATKHFYSKVDTLAGFDVPVKQGEATTTKRYDPADAFLDEGYADRMIQYHPDEDAVDDILRDLDGRPLTKEYFESVMGLEKGSVHGFVCPERDTAFRGLMSHACRVQLELSSSACGGDERTTAFYKRVDFQDLPHAHEKFRTTPHKLVRDMKSYQVVASFLRSQACQKVVEAYAPSLVIPQCYDAQLAPNSMEPLKAKFTFLLQDLSPEDGWYQMWLLDQQEECRAALSTYAKLHAYFWHGSNFWKNSIAAGEELEAGIWESGSYVQPQAQGWKQCHIVNDEWKKKRGRFQEHLGDLEFWDSLGERLDYVARDCGRVAHPFAEGNILAPDYQKYRTFTHGDPKQANLLFRKQNSGEFQVGLIDFQWSGFGLAATDIAHFMTSAVHAGLLVDGGEEQLLKYYYSELQTQLIKNGVYPNTRAAAKEFSYETFLEQYEIGVLDICRLMIAYTWNRFEEPVERSDVEACARTMNKTSYNKSIPTIVWLLTKCHEILNARGV